MCERAIVRRYGGADHLLVCAWWDCRSTLDPSLHMRLARVMVGINERQEDWARCKYLTKVTVKASSKKKGGEYHQ